MGVGNLISSSSAFSKSSLDIWKFTVHILLKPGLENFEHYFASVWDECSCAVIWTFVGIAFLWDWNENSPFPWCWSWSLPPVQCHEPLSIVLLALYLSDLIPWIYLSLPLYKCKRFDLGHTWMAYFLQFKSEFCNKEFMIWATVSSQSCFRWLYRASPSSAAKNIFNLISVITIWWCPCVESSLVCWNRVFAMSSVFSWPNSC